MSQLLDNLKLTAKEDITEGLKPHRIRSSQSGTARIIESIENHINPFDENLDKEVLFNIATGKAASAETADFLLNASRNGEKLRDEFINECAADPKRFHEQIKKVKVKNFTAEGKRVKIKTKNSVIETTMTRDFFGRCLYLALQFNIDMGLVLSYPNTDRLLSLCHSDDTMMKTAKST